MQLLAIQLQPRQAIEHTHSTHATKGGVLEHGTILYNTLCRDKFNQAFEAYLSTHAIDESFFAFWREQAKQNAQSVTAHCRKLSK